MIGVYKQKPAFKNHSYFENTSFEKVTGPK
jgi:hypothetical protein